MKRTSWILLILFAILALLTYLYFNKADTTRTGKEFAINNTAQIGKIVLWDKMKRRITLTKEDKNWQVNGKHEARQEPVDLLLETFNRMRVTSQVPRAAEERVRRSINVNGIITEIYDRNDRLLKTLYVGGSAPGSKATYMMQKGGNYPYQISIPNWEGVLTPRFMMKEIDWRDRAVFRYAANEIKSVKVEYFAPDKKELSFQAIREDNNYQIKKLYGLSEKNPLIQAKVQYYFKRFDELIAENFDLDNPKRAAIVTATPFCEITLVTIEGIEKNVKFYPIPGRKIGKDASGEVLRANTEKYYVAINGNEDFMIVQDRVFKEVFAPVNFFFEKED